MTSINVSNLILTLQQKIDSSTTENELLYYSKALSLLKVGIVNYVQKYSEMPSPILNEGALYYVSEEESVYFANDYGWINLSKQVNNTLYSWGSNGCLVIGNSSFSGTDSSFPIQEGSFSTNWCRANITAITTMAQKNDGTLWGWGAACCGIISPLCAAAGVSFGTNITRESSRIPWKTFCFLSLSTMHALRQDGTLWSWGLNSYGQHGSNISCNTVCVAGDVSQEITKSCWKELSAGVDATVSAIKMDGSLWSWGRGNCGALGDGATVNRCSPVRERCSATNWCKVNRDGDCHGGAIKTDGSLWAWGKNQCGQIGNGSLINTCSPVREICSATDWCSLVKGFDNTLALKTDGSLWAWGDNTCGALGDGTTTTRCSPVRERCSATDWCFLNNYNVGSVAIKTDGSLWSWGCIGCGVHGHNLANSCSPVREKCSETNWCFATIGSSRIVAIKSIST